MINLPSPEFVGKEYCLSSIYFDGDSNGYGENFVCELEKNHNGPHRKTGGDYEFTFDITWKETEKQKTEANKVKIEAELIDELIRKGKIIILRKGATPGISLIQKPEVYEIKRLKK